MIISSTFNSTFKVEIKSKIYYSLDINECQTDQHTCDPAEQTCFNTCGDYLCIPTACPDDYRIGRTGSSNQCVQLCDQPGRCSTQTINYHVISVAATIIDNRLPLLKLVNYDLADLPIERTTFDIVETSSENVGVFRLESIANRQGIVYVYANEGRLETERLYKLKVLGKSYDDKGMTFSTTSVVHVYVQK
jgi:hemicentin